MANSKGNETRYDSPVTQIELARASGSPGLFLKYKKYCVKCKRDKPSLGGSPFRGATSGLQRCADCLVA